MAGCAKHFVGDGGTVKGINENNTIVDQADLFGIHVPAYLNSLEKGVATVMASYSSINGVKMHANRDLLTSFLKDKLGFKVNFCRLPRKLLANCLSVKEKEKLLANLLNKN